MQQKWRVREHKAKSVLQNQFFNNQGLCVMKREKKKGKKQVKTEGRWGGGEVHVVRMCIREFV